MHRFETDEEYRILYQRKRLFDYENKNYMFYNRLPVCTSAPLSIVGSLFPLRAVVI